MLISNTIIASSGVLDVPRSMLFGKLGTRYTSASQLGRLGISVQCTLRHLCLCLLKSIVKGTLYFTAQLLSPLLHYSPAWNCLTTSDLTWRLPCSLSPGSRGGSPTFTTDELSDTSYFIHHGLTTNYISIQNTIWRPARQVRHSGFTVNIQVWYAN